MGEILGLTLADKPNLRMKPHWIAGALKGNIAQGWKDKPHLKDPKNWPEPMRRDWGDDQGTTTAIAFQQRQIEQFRKLRAALDDFKPDFMVVLYRDVGETFESYARPLFWVHAHEQVQLQLFQIFGRRDNYFDEDPDRVDTVLGHRPGALHLARGLQDAGFNPLYSLEPMPHGLGHNLLAATVHLDFDRREFKTPLVPFGVDPFGFLRVRNNEGLSPWDRTLPRPLLPREAFELGRTMARIYRSSPWRVALVAAVDWSHANDAAWEYELIHPDHEADRRRYEQWKNNEFDQWGDNWTFEEMEEHAQWEMLVTIILAGAMTEIGAKVVYSHFDPTWVFLDNVVTTIFEVK